MEAIRILFISLLLALLPIAPARAVTTEISTDVIPWNFRIMNAELGFGVSDAISVGVPVYYAPWFAWKRHAVRVLALQPECRWWPARRQRGHFLAAHITVAWYNVRWGDYRYQDTSRPALGGGLTYGYRIPLGDRWGVEFMLGLGVINTRYDRFHNIENGRRIDTRNTTYFGPDRLSISFSYRL